VVILVNSTATNLRIFSEFQRRGLSGTVLELLAGRNEKMALYAYVADG
jgi:hypothetical protein